ncbi:MAG: hypothetical protein JRF33_22125 [Deltaproteobacteria bacterium]|nr:hypothetical protein [Deltaproteobacteria bacterium]
MGVLLLAWIVLSACEDKKPGALKEVSKEAEPQTVSVEAAGVRAALARAATWMAVFPVEDLRFDAAIGTDALVKLGHKEFEAAFQRARIVAERDDDNPMLRFLHAEFVAPVEAVRRWKAPGEGEKRINTNRPLIEALHCDRHGLRPETLAYIAGPMRDDGGYQTSHAAWALRLAKDRACMDAERFEALVRDFTVEIHKAQSRPFAPKRHLDVDLYAERIWALELLGQAVEEEWISVLLKQQRPDGSFGVMGETDERPYYRYHGTMASAWALGLWLAHQGS